MLDRRNIKTERPNRSLNHKNLGPFRIVKILDNMVYKLDLPDSMAGLHPVFHPWLLHLDNSDPLPGQRVAPPPPVKVTPEGDTIYTAEEIISFKVDKRRNDPVTGQKGYLMYQVKWTGYGHDETTWEPYTHVTDSADLIADFHHSHPNAEGPHRSFKTPAEWAPLLLSMALELTESRGGTCSVPEY